MQRHPTHPPPAFFLKVASSHCHIASKNITKKKHKKKTTMTEKKQRMQRHPKHLGGRRCALPPTPLQPFFSKVASSHCHSASKNITKKKHKKKKTKMTEKKQHMQRRPMHLGGRRCALPPTPLQPFFLKVASSHCHIASKNITKKKHKKKTKNNQKKTTHAKTPNASK